VSTEAMVDAIVERCKLVQPAQVERMPDQPGKQRFAHASAAIWVGYQGSAYQPPEDLTYPVQDRRARFDIALLVRQLHGPRGAAVYLDAVRELLHGWRLPMGGARLALESEQFVDYENGVWRYDLVLSTRRPQVPHESAVGPGETGPALRRLTFEGPGDDVTVIESNGEGS
jgi:hypothetical protein